VTPGRPDQRQSQQPVDKVCHWLCQCLLKLAAACNSALAEPVAHIELRYVPFINGPPFRELVGGPGTTETAASSFAMNDVCMIRYVRTLTTLLIVLVASCDGRVSLAEPVVINTETATYDYHPSSMATASGSIWTAWHGYSEGRDQIIARRFDAQGNAQWLVALTEAGAVHGPPTIVASSDEVASVVWAAKIAGRWRVMLREWRNGSWKPSIMLLSSDHDAIFPTAALMSDGSLLAAWSEHVSGQWLIRACRIERGKPTKPFTVSAGGADAFRPVITLHNGQMWVFWDQYSRPNYAVCGRVVFPESGEVEQVSPAGEYCLTPTVLSHQSGLHVAWLRKIDVVGGPSVISQWHTLHAAVRGSAGWKQIEAANGNTAAAELTQGLMAKIDPRPVATGGYLGPRVRPSLVGDAERVWLLWERKSNHRGSTPTVSGDLVGRPSMNGQWQKPVVLSQGRIDYHVVHPAESRDGDVRMMASRMPRKGLRTYESFRLNLSESIVFEQDVWTGWNPVELPIDEETTHRREISVGGKSYKLFWADLHCHNGLTADAEGQPDEMHNYARDRAGLDVVVFTNNDFYNVPLTQYDFELGNLFASKYSATRGDDQRAFLSLPGFEWTSRIPGVATASLADSGNWLPPYRNRSYPNHRSVIYPSGGGPLVHFTEVGNDITRLNEAVQAAGGITLSQHNAFKLSGHPVEVGMELTSGWSNYIASHPKLFHEPLNKGARLGFTANGDTHRRSLGLSGALTGIYAEELTAESILDALRKRRCFATMGSQIFVDARGWPPDGGRGNSSGRAHYIVAECSGDSGNYRGFADSQRHCDSQIGRRKLANIQNIIHR
jgi:hypothetical protein